MRVVAKRYRRPVTPEERLKRRTRRTAALAVCFLGDPRHPRNSNSAFESIAQRLGGAYFSDARKALRWCAGHKPSAVVLDADSVGQEGPTFVRALRSRGQDSTIIAVSDDLDRTRQTYGALGDHQYVQKPFETSTLQQQIESAAAAHRALTVLRKGTSGALGHAKGSGGSSRGANSAGRHAIVSAIVLLALLAAIGLALRTHGGVDDVAVASFSYCNCFGTAYANEPVISGNA
jgi:CheY-like chemotaxis protein